jgi:hypothetical protein
MTVIISKTELHHPNKPVPPSGPASGKINTVYTYNTSTTDPDGDHVYYLFNWGDGTYSSWLGPYVSGDTIESRNTWTTQGSYEIRVKAKDTLGFESEWSDPLPITMPYLKTRNPFSIFLFEQLMERFPFLWSIIKKL